MHRISPQKHGLRKPPGVQQTVGEHVPPMGISAELHLIDGKKIKGLGKRHCLDRAKKPPGMLRDNLLLPRDQCDGIRRPYQTRPRIILTGQQPQRKPHHPRAMGEHAVKCQPSLPGVGRSQNCGDAIIAFNFLTVSIYNH